MSARQEDAYLHRVVVAVSVAAAAALIVLATWAVSSMLLVIFGGILLAVLLRGLAQLLSEHTGIREQWAVWIVIAVLVATLGVGGWYLWAEVAEQFEALGESLGSIWDQIRNRLERYAWGRQILSVLGDPAASADKAGALGTLLAGIVGGISGLVISVIIGFYVAADPTVYRRGVLRLVPLRHRERATEILHELHEKLQAWLLGMLVLMVLVGTMVTLGLWLLGIPLPLALGAIAFLLEFVPYIGPIAAAIPAVLVASTVGVQEAFFVVLLYWAVQSIEGYLLAPLVFQKSIHIPPMLTLGSQVVLGALLGIVGIIFATPLTACAMVLVQRLYVEDALGDNLEAKPEA